MFLHLQKELGSKYQVIFRMFLQDMAVVQQMYEAGKADPPRPRDVPLVAGCIMWARQLLRRIQEPMQWYASSHLPYSSSLASEFDFHITCCVRMQML